MTEPTFASVRGLCRPLEADAMGITRWGNALQFEYRPADRRQRRPNDLRVLGSSGTGVVAKGTLQVARPFLHRGGPAA